MRGCRPLSRAELELAMSAPRGRWAMRDRCLITLGWCTGFRISEMLAVRVGDVWLRGEVLHSLRVARATMKGSRESRTVPLPAPARAAIEAWVLDMRRRRGRLRTEQYLFQSQAAGNRAITRQQANAIVHQALAGLSRRRGDIGTHSLRKTYARAMYARFKRKGLDAMDAAREVQRLLGHRSVDVTIDYLELGQEEREAEMRGLCLFDVDETVACGREG